MDQWFKNYKQALYKHIIKYPFLLPMAFIVTVATVVIFIVTPANSDDTDLNSTDFSIIPATTMYLDSANLKEYFDGTTTTTSTTTTTTTTTIVPNWDVNNYYCPQWYDMAIAAGWTQDQWPMLSKVIRKESTCNHDSYNPSDPMSGSYGLTQVNGYWCQPVKYNPGVGGWLGELGILDDCQDLFDPMTNLKSALAIYNYQVARYGWGWGPWGL